MLYVPNVLLFPSSHDSDLGPFWSRQLRGLPASDGYFSEIMGTLLLVLSRVQFFSDRSITWYGCTLGPHLSRLRLGEVWLIKRMLDKLINDFDLLSSLGRDVPWDQISAKFVWGRHDFDLLALSQVQFFSNHSPTWLGCTLGPDLPG